MKTKTLVTIPNGSYIVNVLVNGMFQYLVIAFRKEVCPLSTTSMACF
jgi:hypothetical protein